MPLAPLQCLLRLYLRRLIPLQTMPLVTQLSVHTTASSHGSSVSLAMSIVDGKSTATMSTTTSREPPAGAGSDAPGQCQPPLARVKKVSSLSHRSLCGGPSSNRALRPEQTTWRCRSSQQSLFQHLPTSMTCAGCERDSSWPLSLHARTLSVQPFHLPCLPLSTDSAPAALVALWTHHLASCLPAATCSLSPSSPRSLSPSLLPLASSPPPRGLNPSRLSRLSPRGPGHATEAE